MDVEGDWRLRASKPERDLDYRGVTKAHGNLRIRLYPGKMRGRIVVEERSIDEIEMIEKILDLLGRTLDFITTARNAFCIPLQIGRGRTVNG